MYFLSVGGNRIDLIDEDDSWTVFLSLLECFSEVALCFSCHFGHNFRTVNQEEESAGLVSYCSGDQSFS